MEELDLILGINKILTIHAKNESNRVIFHVENHDSEIIFRVDRKDAIKIIEHLKQQFGI